MTRQQQRKEKKLKYELKLIGQTDTIVCLCKGCDSSMRMNTVSLRRKGKSLCVLEVCAICGRIGGKTMAKGHRDVIAHGIVSGTSNISDVIELVDGMNAINRRT